MLVCFQMFGIFWDIFEERFVSNGGLSYKLYPEPLTWFFMGNKMSTLQVFAERIQFQYPHSTIPFRSSDERYTVLMEHCLNYTIPSQIHSLNRVQLSEGSYIRLGPLWIIFYKLLQKYNAYVYYLRNIQLKLTTMLSVRV